MESFRHHPDSIIFINDFNCTLEQFLTFEPEYSLIEGFIGREYIKDEDFSGQIINRAFTKNSETFFKAEDGNGEVWSDGEYYISKVEDYKLLLEELNNISV